MDSPVIITTRRYIDGCWKPGKGVAHERTCATCDGRGQIHYTRRPGSPHRADSWLAECEDCKGAGTTLDRDCGCVECGALALSIGELMEHEVRPESVALLAMWKRNAATEDRPTHYELHQEGMDAK